MRTRRRTLSRMIPALESLDARVTPAFVGSGVGQFLSNLGTQLQQSSANSGVGQFLSNLGTQLQPMSPQPVRGAPFSGPQGQTSASGNLGLGRGNGPPGQSSTGPGAVGTTGNVILNPARDHALGREPVIVGLQAPGIGMFTSNLAIQFLQNSAQATRPFNEVPGAGASFGFAFV
jgi:hypothetical protein